MSPPVELYVVWDFYEKDKTVDRTMHKIDEMWSLIKKAGSRGRDALIANYVANNNSVASFDHLEENDLKMNAH